MIATSYIEPKVFFDFMRFGAHPDEFIHLQPGPADSMAGIAARFGSNVPGVLPYRQRVLAMNQVFLSSQDIDRLDFKTTDVPMIGIAEIVLGERSC